MFVMGSNNSQDALHVVFDNQAHLSKHALRFLGGRYFDSTFMNTNMLCADTSSDGEVTIEDDVNEIWEHYGTKTGASRMFVKRETKVVYSLE